MKRYYEGMVASDRHLAVDFTGSHLMGSWRRISRILTDKAEKKILQKPASLHIRGIL